MSQHQYIIVGAGPAGLQMGYFLEQAGLDYVILESEARAGSFFERYPRHRTLISLNKVYNWFDEPDFNLRYDWNSLLTDDNSLKFTEYTKKLYPHADVLVKYLNDFADKFALRIQYNTRVTRIEREAGGTRHFILTDSNGGHYSAPCLLMATGAVKPNIPSDIEGIELAEGYEVHEIDPERFTNKRVVILGHGNSAFEIADHISNHAATIQIFTGGKLIRHAWQTHFVGDLRAINNTMLEMNQLKMPHLVSGARITKLIRQEDGTIKVCYEEDVPHWAVPGTMRSSGVYDYVIRATGWKYIEPSLFAPDVLPESDAKAKFPKVSSIWESTVPDLFFIGAAMANNDRKTTPGFIHGFRYNVRTLFHLLRERYQKARLPSKTWPLTSAEELESLVQAILTRISTTSALYQMFGVLGEAVVLTRDQTKWQAQWFSELPMKHSLLRPEFTADRELLTITLELGFDNYPTGTDSLSFIHPNDPGGQGRCGVFIHPVFRRYTNGRQTDEMHLQSGVFVRYDEPNSRFALEFDKSKPHNMVFNLVNSIVKVTDEILPTNTFAEDGETGGFTPWGPELEADATGLPKCVHTHQPERKTELASYR